MRCDDEACLNAIRDWTPTAAAIAFAVLCVVVLFLVMRGWWRERGQKP